MSYNGLSQNGRKRATRASASAGEDEPYPADEVAGDEDAEAVSWDEAAQDQVFALLDDVDEVGEEQLDLAALRRALAEQHEQEEAPNQDTPPADPPAEAIPTQADQPEAVDAASDTTPADEHTSAASHDEPVPRLDWLDKLLSSKRKQEPEKPPSTPAPAPPPVENPAHAIDELLAASSSASEPAKVPASPEAQAPAEPEEILDLSEYSDYLELEWNEEFASKREDSAKETPEAPQRDTNSEQASSKPSDSTQPSDSALQWTSLADLSALEEGEAPPAQKQNGTPSFDGSPVDGTDTPVPDVADWTRQGARAAEAPTPPPAEEVSFVQHTPAPAQPKPPVQQSAPVESTPAPPAVSTADATPAKTASAAPVPSTDATSEAAAPAQEAAPAQDAAPAKEEPPSPAVPDVDLKKVTSRDRVVAMLLKKKIVEPDAVKIAYDYQQKEKSKDPVWRILATTSDTARHQIFEEAASVYAFRKVEFGREKPDPEFARSVMETFEDELRDGLMRLRVIPLAVDLDQQTGAIKVVFITHDPTRPEVHRMMQKLKLERFELRYAPENIVTGLMLEAFPRRNEFLDRLDEDNAYDLGSSYDSRNNDLIDEDALEAEISRSKLINLFEATLVESVRLGASDVHIWPNADKHVEIHMRIDGRLQRWHLEDKIHPEALIAVIKDNSMNVDRFERDAAQDGFIQRWIDEALIRFRVSVLPIANAATDVRSESIVIRVLDDRKVIKDLRKLGLHELSYQRFRKAIAQPHGMVILTGPTGSGKTTTLYASLHEVVSPEVNVLTVEDPVEYILPGVRQIKLNNKLGLEGALRSILRHDPDVVMVGEMRDKETAELAIKLANTGHLTFSTLHTNDAASAVTRLYKMDIEPFLIAYAINLVVAQRLIRRLCTECKQVDDDPDPVLMKNLGFEPEDIDRLTFYIEGEDNENCPKCKGLGYKGRRAVTEALYFSREIRHLIADSEGKLDENDIKDLAMKQGMMTLQDSAREVVKEGDTSILEMLRVVATED